MSSWKAAKLPIFLIQPTLMTVTWTLMQYGFWSFHERIQNEIDFWAKINSLIGNHCILSIDVKKCKNLTFKVNFLCQQARNTSFWSDGFKAMKSSPLLGTLCGSEFWFQTWDNSQLLRRVLWIRAELTIVSSLKHKNTQPLYIFKRENPQNSEPQNGPRSGLDYIALHLFTVTFGFPNSKKNSFRGNYIRKYSISTFWTQW